MQSLCISFFWTWVEVTGHCSLCQLWWFLLLALKFGIKPLKQNWKKILLWELLQAYQRWTQMQKEIIYLCGLAPLLVILHWGDLESLADSLKHTLLWRFLKGLSTLFPSAISVQKALLLVSPDKNMGVKYFFFSFLLFFSLDFDFVKEEMRKDAFLFTVTSFIIFLTMPAVLFFLISGSFFVYMFFPFINAASLWPWLFPLATRGTKLFCKSNVKIVLSWSRLSHDFSFSDLLGRSNSDIFQVSMVILWL